MIAGSAKGMKLKAPKGQNTRPTTDRVKESLFSMIHSYLVDSFVLDLFSGTGSLGIEALSRGAEAAYFVDNNKMSIQVIKDNIEHTGYKEISNVFFSDVGKMIKEFGQKEKKFDVIFMDPPYLKDFIIPCIEDISIHKILKEEGIIVVEHDIEDLLPDQIQNLTKLKEKKYGNTLITIYSKE
ncbi:16S rRNA (guanine(966)-N(2))-methyltransferase RsmD [Inediibacterium massiliense]|uniref:16S rRNA (guanine(966)-N(2))-methyltransferase RsmD n=1 Tax=Inediibacterium massiliense TaxID=1658111 RepID=UPI001FA6D0EC|nr:16S rRNA (guanine(966)-N(2))-methyltransferase RsmD [Inediibacterium massiliense]